MHNCHQFDCIVKSHCTRTTFCKTTNSDDNIKWFHHHCSSTYNWLETSVPIVDMAMFTIKHIKRLFISQVSEKVKSDIFRIIIEYSKANGDLVVFYIKPITVCLLDPIEDNEFNVDNFMTYHLSMPIDVPVQSSSLENLLEQGTQLTNNLSEHIKKVWSRQLQRIHVEHSENTPKQTSVDEEGVHTELATDVTNTSKIAPVNLEMSFAAEQSEERSDRPDSPFASNRGLYETPPETHKAKVLMKYNKFCKQYSIADAWINSNIATYQRKLSGRRSADSKVLYSYLECSTCAFPYKDCFIPTGEKSYTNVCANTDVWLDGDFISAFASSVCYNNHSLVPTALMKSG
jgi:hypothetical protein